MKHLIFCCIALVSTSTLISSAENGKADLRIYGTADTGDALGTIAISLIDAFHKELDIEFIRSHKPTVGAAGTPQYHGISSEVYHIINTKPLKSNAKVGVMTNVLPPLLNFWVYQHIQSCDIKLAISMQEADAIPKAWTEILNKFFDAVIVPDKYLVNVYKNCGVLIPIFVLPLPIYLDNFLKRPLKMESNEIFTFGMSAAFQNRKNHIRVLEAFQQEFGSDPKFRLKLHGRFSWQKSILSELKKYIKHHKLQNVELILKKMDKEEHIAFLARLDCYVFLSKGEGFSQTPREALALGLPCILSNNTVHTTICDTNYVYPVPAQIKNPAYLEAFNRYVGHDFDCTTADARLAMRTVYENYDLFLEKARMGREWVKRYRLELLKDYYRQIFQPSRIELGKENIVMKDGLSISSNQLFIQYKKLQ